MKQVLITGSSRGIGKETALYLAKNGYDIVLHCNKNIDKAKEIKEEIKKIGQKARILQFDISNREECNKVLSEDTEKNGMYFGIVLNAGIAKDNCFPALEAL